MKNRSEANLDWSMVIKIRSHNSMTYNAPYITATASSLSTSAVLDSLPTLSLTVLPDKEDIDIEPLLGIVFAVADRASLGRASRAH